MKNKISYGLNQTIDLALQKSFIKYYKPYILSVYCTIPNLLLSETLSAFHPVLEKAFDAHYYDEFIDFLHTEEIKLNFTINSITLTPPTAEELNLILEAFNLYLPDEVCCSDKYINTLKSFYLGNYFRTILLGISTPEDIETLNYDGYMFRSTYPFEYNLPKNKESRILTDFACHTTCKHSCNVLTLHKTTLGCPHLVKIFDIEMETLDNKLEKYLAHHLLLGKDLELLELAYPSNSISYKYASRMHTSKKTLLHSLNILNEFSNAFNNYINGSNTFDFNSKSLLYLLNGCGLTEWVEECYDWETFDRDLFYEEKLKWWQKLLPNLSNY